MSIQISTGTVDTAVSGATAPQLTLPLLNWQADFRVLSSTNKDVVMTNVTTPIDQKETVRLGYLEIANIYSKSGLNSDQISGTVRGLQILAQLNETIKVTDSANTAFSQYLPISAHLIIKVPQSAFITEAVMQSLVTRLVATLYENGVTSLPALSKGVLSPKGI